MDKILISVIIAAYNAEKFIKETIDSVLEQTFQNFEIIVVDDGSTDGTADVVKAFNDVRIKYIYQENASQAMARNKGISISSGEFLAFLDADDVWTSDKLEKQIKIFENKQVGLVYTAFSLINENGNKIPSKNVRFYRGKVSEKLCLSNFVTNSSVMVRKSVLADNNLLFRADRKGTEDWDLWLRLSIVTEFEFVEEPLLKYRQYSSSVSKNGELMFRSHMTTINEFRDFVNEKKPENKDILMKLSFKAEAIYEFCYAFWLYKNKRAKEALYMLFSAFRHDFFVLWDYFLSTK